MGIREGAAKAAAAIALIGLLTLGLAACGGGGSSTTSSGTGSEGSEGTESSKELTEVSFLTGFGNGPWDAGFAVAQQKGFYEEAGLKVDIKAGQGSTSNLQLVANGNATFGHVGGAATAIGIEKGLPVKAIGSYFQIAGSGIMTDTDIKTPQDMEGKTFGGSPYDFTTLLLPLFEKTEGISGIKEVNVEPGSIPTVFLQGRTEMMTAAEWAEVPEVEAEGKEFNYFSYAEAGLNLMGPSIVTSDATLEKEPEAAKEFVEASGKGYEWAYEHPEEAAEIVHEVWPTTTAKFNEAVVPTLKKFTHTEATEGDNIGWMAKSDWEQTERLLKEGEQISSEIPVDQVYKNVVAEK